MVQPAGEAAAHSAGSVQLEMNASAAAAVDIADHKPAAGSADSSHAEVERCVEERTAELLKSNQELRRELEQRKRTEEEFREIADHVPGLISYIDTDERTRYVNRPDEVWFGIRRGDVIGMHSKDVVGKEAYEFVSEHIDRAWTGENVQFELPMLKNREESGWGLVSIFPDVDDRREIKGFFCFLSDITEQKRAEKALRESEERFRQLAENIREVFWLRSGDGRELTYVSPAYETIWWRTCQSLYENPSGLIEAIHPDDQAFVKEAFATARVEKQEFDQEYRILRPDGTIRWIRDRGFPVQDEHGVVRRIAGIAEDITQWKSAEEQLRAYQRQLRSLASELSLAEERERHSIAADLHDHVGQTLALAKIKLGGHRESLSDPEQLASIDEVRELLDHTIRDTRSLYLELSPPVLYELGFESAVEWLCDQTHKQHGIVCNVHNDAQPKPLGDDFRIVLFQAVRELLFNVAKHAQVTQANVTLERIGDDLRVQVEDTGVGFHPDTETEEVSGMQGYGLFSIGERISFLGGSFDVQSEPGKGTRVMITAPLKLE